MQFSKAFIVIAAAIMPSVMAACSAGAPFQGSCLSCTSECWDTYNAPDRITNLQRAGCMSQCLALCDDCD
ncbi:hypothetical protein CcaCcLH18_13131 [Colletotrichum camelliae]|nr:hypothetical protein CcaCcLH18_13131 [Colletotrichum camelliae]